VLGARPLLGELTPCGWRLLLAGQADSAR